MLVDRGRIVDPRPDPLSRQALTHNVPAIHGNHEEMIAPLAPRPVRRKPHVAQSLQPRAVATRDGSPASDPAAEVIKLHAKQRGLQLIQARVPPLDHTPVPSLIAVHAEEAKLSREPLILDQYQPSVS